MMITDGIIVTHWSCCIIPLISLRLCFSFCEVEVRGRSLHFWLNGEDQGPAFTNLPTGKMLFAAVSLYNEKESLVVVSHSYNS